MEKFEFRYHHKSFANKLLVAMILAGLISFFSRSANIFVSPIIFETYARVIYAIAVVSSWTFLSAAFCCFFRTNANGVGILYDEYVEIKLKDKEYHIEFDDITEIAKEWWVLLPAPKRWRIYIHNKPDLVICQGNGLRKRVNLYPLEKFMEALEERLDLNAM